MINKQVGRSYLDILLKNSNVFDDLLIRALAKGGKSEEIGDFAKNCENWLIKEK